MPTRVLRWEGCVNVRDLGGVPTEDGGETRFGVVVRADNVSRLRDLATLARHGIARVVDLRFDEEVQADGATHVPVEVVRVPLVDFDPAYRAHLEERALQMDGAAYLAWSYLDMLDRFHGNFARAVCAVAEAEGPVCVHCQGGRDRTGLVAALLLRLAGASVNAVAEDYWLSEEALRADTESWIAEATSERDRVVRSVFLTAPREAMASVVEAVERRHGSVRAYLEAGGAPVQALRALSSRLRGTESIA